MNKFGIIWEDENALITGFHDTEEEAWKEYDDFGAESREGHYVAEFTPEQQEESKNWPEI